MAEPGADRILTVTVVRSGGFAGLTRIWRVSAARAECDEWMPLVDACPWREAHPQSPARDRFVWRIEVRAPGRRHEAVLPESDLAGPWRDLVDRVRAAGDAPAAGPSD